MTKIPISEACLALGISNSAICVAKRYADYYTPSSPGTRNASFNLKGFTDHDDVKTELIEKVSLFTEYLNKEKMMTYEKIAKVGGVNFQQVALCNMGYKKSLQLAMSFRCSQNTLIRQFDKFYGYK